MRHINSCIKQQGLKQRHHPQLAQVLQQLCQLFACLRCQHQVPPARQQTRPSAPAWEGGLGVCAQGLCDVVLNLLMCCSGRSMALTLGPAGWDMHTQEAFARLLNNKVEGCGGFALPAAGHSHHK